MSLADKVLAVNNDLPIKTNIPVHSGKVRSVYWLTKEDSRRLIQEKPLQRCPRCTTRHYGNQRPNLRV